MAASNDPNGKPIVPIHSNELQDLSEAEKQLETRATPRCNECYAPAADDGRDGYWCVYCAREVHEHPTEKPQEERSSKEKRFWTNVLIGEPDQCWRWTGHSERYGKVQIDGKADQSHRLAYALDRGLDSTDDIKDDVIKHNCHVELCCNPLHLEGGTQSENLIQACTEGDRDTRFSDAEIRRIRREYSETEKVLKDFADEFDVSIQMISGIVNRDYYEWVE